MTDGTLEENGTLEEIRAMVPELARDAAEVDIQGRVDDRVIDRLDRLGLFRTFRPVDHGGLAGDPVDFFRAVRLLSRGCTATGWVASALASHEWHLALFESGAQDDVWGGGERALITSCYLPDGTATPAPGGYRVSGRWRAATGVHHAGWAILAATVLDTDDQPVDYLQVLVPAGDYTVEQSWDPTGLRAIGADSIVVTDAVVPTHRVFGASGRMGHEDAATLASLAPVHRLPYSTITTHAVAVPALGAAEGAYAALVAERPEAAELPTVARTVTDLHASWLQVQRNLADLMEIARTEAVPDEDAALRARRDQALLAERGVRACRYLLDAAGTEAWGRHHPLQRAWREAQVARTNAANHAEDVLSTYGRWIYGVEIDDRWW